MANEEGFIKVNRKLLDWEHSDNLAMTGFWIHLLLLANWEDKKKVKRGEIITTIPVLASICGCSNRTVDRYLAKLRESGEIETSTNHRNTKIRIINYEQYQSGKNDATAVVTGVVTDDATAVVTGVVTHPYKRNKEEKKGRTKENTPYKESAGESPASVEPIPLNDGTFWLPTQDLYEEYCRLYPAVDIEQEFRKMRGWCDGNPAKRKTRSGVKRFVSGWLAREQDNPRKTTENRTEKKEVWF